MGSSIQIKSRLGKGSTFFFTLPYITAEHTAPEFPAFIKNLNILVIDDNETTIEIINNILINLGLNPKGINNAKDALIELEAASLKNQPYDLILTDWHMPKMDGIELIKRIKTSEHILNTPTIIMVTAYNKRELIDMTIDLEIDGYLSKPVYPSTLLDTITETLDSSYHRASSTTTNDESQAVTELLQQQLDGTSLLLVEDNTFNQQIAIETLKSFNINVDLAKDGLECLEMLEKNEYEIVLMDIQMPRMDGLTATREIRQRWPDRHLPIIAMTAHTMDKDKDECLKAGMDHHVAKPFILTELTSTLLKWVEPKTKKHSNQDKANATKPISTNKLHSGLNMATLHSSYSSDNNNVKEILNIFINSFHPDTRSVIELLSDHKFDEARILAHSMRTSAAYLGDEVLVDSATKLEQALQSSHIEEAQTEAVFFNQQLNKLLIMVENELEKLEHDSSDAN